MNPQQSQSTPPIRVITPPQPKPERRPARWLMAVIAGLVAVGLASGLIIRNQSQQAALAREVKVNITTSAFDPATVTVVAGGKVTWMNQDTQPHGVTINGIGVSAPYALAHGQTYTYTFTQKGSYTFYDPENLTYPKGTISVQ